MQNSKSLYKVQISNDGQWLWATNIKVNKMNHNKALKDRINRMKMQSIDWEKIFANCVSDKGLISRIYKVILTTGQ